MPEVAGLLLAAGAGRRFGMPKALALLGQRPFLRIALDALGGCAPVVLVLGAGAEQVPEQPGVTVVVNQDWSTGMGSSLRAGLDALAPSSVAAVVVLPVDTPGVTAAAVARLAALAGPDALARATYLGVPGHPVLIGRSHWPEVHALATGDRGARDYLAAHPVTEVDCSDVATGTDIDTLEDLP